MIKTITKHEEIHNEQIQTAMTTFCPAKEIRRGLSVSSEMNNKDHYLLTHFDIRFATPGVDEPLDKDTMQILKCVFKEYLHKSEYSQSVCSFMEIFSTGVSLNLWDFLEKEEALDLIVNMCRYLCSYTIPENKKSIIPKEGIDCLDKTKQFIQKYMYDITENGLYEYSRRSKWN